MKSFIKNLKELLKYPSAIAGLSMIALLILLSILALNNVSIPGSDQALEGCRRGLVYFPQICTTYLDKLVPAEQVIRNHQCKQYG